MVAGAVAPPRIDLGNRDLIRSHIHAIWMEGAGAPAAHQTDHGASAEPKPRSLDEIVRDIQQQREKPDETPP
jgi:hypothetical protein